MNKISATITAIENVENLHLVTCDFEGDILTILSLELPHGVKKGSLVELTTKPSHVVLAKEWSGDISVSNRLEGTVSAINAGELVSMVETKVHQSTMQTLMTTKSLKRMGLKESERVVLLLQASALSIMECV